MKVSRVPVKKLPVAEIRSGAVVPGRPTADRSYFHLLQRIGLVHRFQNSDHIINGATPSPNPLPRGERAKERTNFKPSPLVGEGWARGRPQTRWRQNFGNAVLAALVAVLAGCTVGPDYVRPDTPISSVFKEAADQPKPPDGVAWNPARPQDDSDRGAWWKIFGDKLLDELEGQVDSGNQDLKTAEAKLRQARAQIGIQASAEYPTISTGPSVSSLKDSAHQPYFALQNPRPTGQFTLPFDLDYELDFWGRIHRSVTAAKEEAQATDADLATASLSLHAELALDYVELRASDAQQKLLDDTVVAFADALQLTQNRLAGGAASESDVAQAETQLATARAQATDIAAQRAQEEHAIAVLIGKPPADFSLPPAPMALRMPILPPLLPSELLERRPDIAAAERRMAEANEQIGIAEAAFYPTFSLGGSSGFEGTSPGSWLGWPSLFWSVGLSASQTLFDAGKRQAQSDAAKAGYDAAVSTYRSTTLTAFQQVEDNLAALRVLTREDTEQAAAVAAAENALRIATNRYVGGFDPYLLVITSQTTALTNQRNAVDVQRRKVEAAVALVKALGGGWQVETAAAGR